MTSAALRGPLALNRKRTWMSYRVLSKYTQLDICLGPLLRAPLNTARDPFIQDNPEIEKLPSPDEQDGERKIARKGAGKKKWILASSTHSLQPELHEAGGHMWVVTHPTILEGQGCSITRG